MLFPLFSRQIEHSICPDIFTELNGFCMTRKSSFDFKPFQKLKHIGLTGCWCGIFQTLNPLYFNVKILDGEEQLRA